MLLIGLSAMMLSFDRGLHRNGCMGDAMSLKENVEKSYLNCG
jgi:hypothetical protein